MTLKACPEQSLSQIGLFGEYYKTKSRSVGSGSNGVKNQSGANKH